MIIIPLIAIAFPFRLNQESRLYGYMLAGLLYLFMIGFRHQVGGDWESYLAKYAEMRDMDVSELLALGDPGYGLLSRFSGIFTSHIYFVNFVCAAIFIYGLIVFCREQPLPWLAVLISVPYLIIVIAMGYTRQSVAIGFELLAIVEISRQRFFRYILFIALGTLFHKSAIVLAPLGILAVTRHRLTTILVIALSSVVLFFALVAEYYDTILFNYIDSNKESAGGLIRITMNAIPSIALLLFHRHFREQRYGGFWFAIAIISIGMIPIVGIASTAVDRIALYFIPIQVYFYSKLPTLARHRVAAMILMFFIIAYSTMVQFVWLNYSDNAWAWLPYQMWPFCDC